jgi:hypothetical protein
MEISSNQQEGLISRLLLQIQVLVAELNIKLNMRFKRLKKLKENVSNGQKINAPQNKGENANPMWTGNVKLNTDKNVGTGLTRNVKTLGEMTAKLKQKKNVISTTGPNKSHILKMNAAQKKKEDVTNIGKNPNPEEKFGWTTQQHVRTMIKQNADQFRNSAQKLKDIHNAKMCHTKIAIG